MANTNAPAGLIPLEYGNGAPWTGQCRTYYVPSSDTNALAMGDPVVLAGSADANGVASVTLATAGAGFLGVVVGWGTAYGPANGDPDSQNTTIIPATKTKAYYVKVVDDPNVVFEVQELGTGTQLTAAAVGLNANLVAAANNGYVSGWMLDNATEATTATLDVKLLGLVQRRNNEFGAYAKWRVMINNHNLRAGITGV